MKKSLVYTIALVAVIAIAATAIFPSGRTQTPVPQDETGHLHLVYSHYFIEGSLAVVGEVTNTGPNIITNIILTGQVAMGDGQQGSTGGKAWVTYLTPNQHAPFYLEFYAPNTLNGAWPNQDIVALQIFVVHAEATSNYEYADLKITNDHAYIGSGSEDRGTYWVEGNIQNIGTQQARNVSIVATFYNSTGCPVGIGSTGQETVKPNMLGPSDSATFKLGAFDLNQTIVPPELKITSYSLLPQVIEPILQGSPPVTTPTPSPGATLGPTDSTDTSSPSDTTSPTAYSGVSAPVETPTWIYATAVVIALGAIIGVIVVMKRPKTHEKPTKPAKKPAAVKKPAAEPPAPQAKPAVKKPKRRPS